MVTAIFMIFLRINYFGLHIIQSWTPHFFFLASTCWLDSMLKIDSDINGRSKYGTSKFMNHLNYFLDICIEYYLVPKTLEVVHHFTSSKLSIHSRDITIF